MFSITVVKDQAAVDALNILDKATETLRTDGCTRRLVYQTLTNAIMYLTTGRIDGVRGIGEPPLEG